MPARTIASQIYPHLPSVEPERTQRAQSDLASAMYPSLVPKPKPAPNPQRDRLLANLRELNAKIDARLARERDRQP